jgi:drug/metabolite transporter (DMT)-like permease
MLLFEKFQIANAFLSLGWVGLFSSIIWAINNFTLVYSLQTTAAANSLVILAANPLFSALGSDRECLYSQRNHTLSHNHCVIDLLSFDCVDFLWRFNVK